MPTPRSLYVHVPFCRRVCPYCAFDVTPHRKTEDQTSFLDALATELALRTHGDRPPLDTLYIGGGTPSALDPPQLRRLFEVLHQATDLTAAREVTIELNPEDVDRALAGLLRDQGVTRASLGVQSFDPRRLRQLGRLHNPDRIAQALGDLRSVGFVNITVDLIYAVPGQSIDDWGAELNALLRHAVPHVSLYSLTFEPSTPFQRAVERGKTIPPEDDVAAAMFRLAVSRLGHDGIEWYEVSNFARPGFESLHNQVYWRNEEYLGCGPAAYSCVDGVRIQNKTTLLSWSADLRAGGDGITERIDLDNRARYLETLLTGLRTRQGVDLARLSDATGFDARTLRAAHLHDLTTGGLALFDGRTLKLTTDGILLLDSILLPFFDDLESAAGHPS